MENNNKESFKLLGVSPSGSDSASEVPEFVLAPPRKKKIKRFSVHLILIYIIFRRLRGTSGSRTRQPQHVCGCHGRMVGLSIATVLLISWLFMITWLAVVLHRELKRLDTNVQNGEFKI
ncbi:hypothetical protein C0J52_23468 [Blattella germanica]|nr:hypothetical protein C0J52_23468 [Blattella germanica]